MTTALQCDERQSVDIMWPEPDMSSRITTTLYDLIWAIQTVTPPDEDNAIVARVMSWMRDGRLRAAREV